MKIAGNRYLAAIMNCILCFSVLTLPYYLPKIIETPSNNIVDAVYGNFYHNPFSSSFFMTVKAGIEVNLVTKEFRLINALFLFKDIENLPTEAQNINHWFGNPLPAKSLPLFLINRYLRI